MSFFDRTADDLVELGIRLEGHMRAQAMTAFREEVVGHWENTGDDGLDRLLAVLAASVDAVVTDPGMRGPYGVLVNHIIPLPKLLEDAYFAFLVNPADEGMPYLKGFSAQKRRSACIALAGRAVASSHCLAAGMGMSYAEISEIASSEEMLKIYGTEARSAAVLILVTCLARTERAGN